MPLPNSVVDNPAVAFAPLSGETALTRVVRVMCSAVSDPARAVVAAAEGLVADVRDALASSDLLSVGVTGVVGGSRAQCVASAVQYLESQSLSSSHVLVHDIFRPLVSVDVQQRVIAALRDGAAIVMPALAVTDSVKAVDARGFVTATVDRSALRAIQYPRGFAADGLLRLLARSDSDEFDELEEALSAGAPITVVDGDADGFRVDLPTDAQFVEALIASRVGTPRVR